MRAFIAIEVSDDIKNIMARVESHLKYSGADVKWVDPANIHITLKFLGEITEDKRDKITSLLDIEARSLRPFELAPGPVGAFPCIERARVIWSGLSKGAAETSSIFEKVDMALADLGFPEETREFSPHLTIGRVRSSINRDKLKDRISSASSIILSSGITSKKVSSLVLFQSTLSPRGSIYTKLHECSFGS